jgi:hypothetical protein
MGKPTTSTPSGGSSGKGDAPCKPARKRRTSHRFRWNVRLLVGIPLLIALVVLLAMRSPLVGGIVASRITRLTGCTLEGTGATGVYVDLSGRLNIQHFRLRLPDSGADGVKGEAGILMSADAAVVDLDWSGVLKGDVLPTALRLQKPVFRVSQCVEDGEVNIAALSKRAGAGAGGGGGGGVLTHRPPRVDAIDGTIILGEHSRETGSVRVLREIKVSGSFMPVETRRPVYAVKFSEIGRPGEGGMILDGRVDLGTGQMRLQLMNLALDSWKPESVPTAYRELWRRLNVQGKVSSVMLTYEKDSGTRALVTLAGVSMNALVPAEGSGPGEMHDLGLAGVSGTVQLSKAGLRANLKGRVEGQKGESELTLSTEGTDINSALRCELVARRIGLTRETEFLPYMPERAKQYLRLFSGPTGEIDARLTVSRGAPVNGEPGAIKVSGGRVLLRHGSAAFQRFPYPFREMAGTFEFDDESIRITELTGTGPTGATLQASGLISPLTDAAMVDVIVHAEKVPVDHHLLDAMPGDRRRVVEAIFSRPEYERLVADGLVRAPGAEGPGREFPLAGLCTIDVHVHTPEGKDAPWFTTIDVKFPTAGIVPDPFPLPIFGRDVALHITDDEARLVSGTFTPLSGGSVSMSALVEFTHDGVKQTRPDVRIRASDVPLDAMLLHALPRDEAAAGEKTTGRDIQLGELMRRLNPSGTLSCDARITADPDAKTAPGETPRIAYDVDVDLARARLEPRAVGGEPAFAVRGFDGHLRVSRASLEAHDVRATLVPIAGEGPDGEGATPLTLNLEKRLAGDSGAERGRMEATIAAPGLSLGLPIERLVGVFSPEGAETLGSLRADHHPTGRLDTTLRLHRNPGEASSTEIGVSLANPGGIEFDALSGRIGMVWPEGHVEVVIPEEGANRIRFDRLRAVLTRDGAACGEATADGYAAIDSGGGTIGPSAELAAEFKDWRFESPLILPLLRRLAGEQAATTYRAFNATGPFDATVRVSSADAPHGAKQVGAPPAQPDAASVRAELRPRRMAFDWEGKRIVCDEVSGKVTLRTLTGAAQAASHPVWGRFDGLSVRTAHWNASADGEWYAPSAPEDAARSVQVSLKFGLSGDRIDDGLRALLPESAVGAMDALGADIHGPFALSNAVVRTTLGDEPASTAFTGELAFEDLSMDLGVRIDHVTGRLSLDVDDRAASRGVGGATNFRMEMNADTLRVAGVRAMTAHAIVRSGEAAGEILVPEIEARCYGGRLTGHASVQLAPEQVGPDNKPLPRGPARYQTEIVIAGVELGPVLADASAAGATEPEPMGPPIPGAPGEPSRGLIDARLTLSGVSGDLSSRRGNGAIRITRGDILRMPVMLPLIQVSNLQIPRKDRLGYLQSDFVINGDTADFQHIALLSNVVEIEGEGKLKWPDFGLDMHFNSRSLARVPLLTDLFETVRNEFVTTTVRGTLADPVVREEPFTGTRRAIDRLLHPRDYTVLAPSSPIAGISPPRAERKRTETGIGAAPNQ